MPSFYPRMGCKLSVLSTRAWGANLVCFLQRDVSLLRKSDRVLGGPENLKLGSQRLDA